MIQLEQIQQLQERVLAAVHKIDALQQENAQLRTQAGKAEQKAAELQQQLDSHNTQYAQIEEGILHALSHLDSLEDAVAQASSPEQSGGPAEGIVTEPVKQEEPHTQDETAETEQPADEPEAELDIF